MFLTHYMWSKKGYCTKTKPTRCLNFKHASFTCWNICFLQVSYKCHKHMCRKHISCNQLPPTAVVLLCTGISHKEPRTEEVKLEVHIHVSSFTALLALDTSLLTLLISFGTCCTTIGKDQLWRAWEQACMFGDHNMNVHLLSEVQVFLWLQLSNVSGCW